MHVLEAHGLNKRAARIYVTLVHRGSLTATELAGALHTNRMGIYRSIEGLVQHGFVTTSLGTPTRYTAVPINTVIDVLITEREHEMETLQHLREDLADRGEHLVKKDEALTSFHVVKGRARAIAVATKLIQQAETRVTFVVGSEEVPFALRTGLVDACRDAARTLCSRGITDINRSNRTPIAETLKGVPDLELRHLARYRGLQYISVDERKSLVGVVTDPSTSGGVNAKDTFLYVMSTAFARSLDATFACLWNNATEATVRLDELADNT